MLPVDIALQRQENPRLNVKRRYSQLRFMSINVECGADEELHMLEQESTYKRNRENNNGYNFDNTKTAILIRVAALVGILVLTTQQQCQQCWHVP